MIQHILSENSEISDPGDLCRILDAIKSDVNDGELEQCWPEEAMFTTEQDVREIPSDGPWPDYIELYFRSPRTGKSFKLQVETFHGTGGSWSVG